MLISLKNIDYYYSKDTAYEIHALKNVSTEIRNNEFIGIIGHTGSGKSTFVQLLNALERPTSGQIIYDGKDIWSKEFDRKLLRSKIGLVFQYPEHQLFETDVFRDVCFGPKNFGLSNELIEERADWALSMVGFNKDLYKASPFELSGGQKRRVAIAGVLALKPEVLVLDEPTAGLDPVSRDELLDTLRALKNNENITIILVSHSMEDVAEYVDRLLVFNDGILMFDDEKRKVFSHSEEIEGMGLSLPGIGYVLNELKKNGLDVDNSCITVDEAAETIIKALDKRKSKCLEK